MLWAKAELFCQDLETAASSHAAGRPVLVACAGCYPTATSLAAAPAVRAGWVAENGPVIVDAISGVTGAGKSCNARTHFCSADENLEAYGVGKKSEDFLEMPPAFDSTSYWQSSFPSIGA